MLRIWYVQRDIIDGNVDRPMCVFRSKDFNIRYRRADRSGQVSDVRIVLVDREAIHDLRNVHAESEWEFHRSRHGICGSYRCPRRVLLERQVEETNVNRLDRVDGCSGDEGHWK